MSARWVDALTVLGLVGLLALVSLTAPRWATVFSRPVPVEADLLPEDGAAPETDSGSADAEVARTINVKLFFEAPERQGLVIEERTVPLFADLSRQIRAVIGELIRGSQSGLTSPLAADTRVLEVFVAPRGVAYVDLSPEVAAEHQGGSDSELLTVYSIVNSVVVNFPSIHHVQILVDSRPPATLAGHVDLSRPLRGDLTLLAASRPALPGAGGGEGPEPPGPGSTGAGDAPPRGTP
jgi:germination protein M